MAQIRTSISGGYKEQLLEREVRALNLQSRKQLLNSAGITHYIPAEQGLALKADLALPWNKMQELRR